MGKKHAYLIMAHNNFYCLEKLLMLLDDARNDIFLHIDAKVKKFDFEYFRALCARAHVFFSKKRINVKWGTQSQVRGELVLFQAAVANGPYHYYHFLSGSDLPLVSQQTMHAFFDGRSDCFMTVHEELSIYDYQRISRYHSVFGKKMPWSAKLNGYFDTVQERLGVDRIKHLKGMIIKRGWNWVSLPHSAAELLVKKKRWILRITRYSICADEIYKQLVLLNSPEKMYRKDDKCTSLRFVDWDRRTGNHPHTFTAEDFALLTQSEMLFARKFDERVDKQIIDMIFDHVRRQEEKP